MAAYSLDLRERIVEAVERRISSKRKIAELFGVHESFLYKLWRQKRDRGDLAPLPHGGGAEAKLAADSIEEDAPRANILVRPAREQVARLELLLEAVGQRDGVRRKAAAQEMRRMPHVGPTRFDAVVETDRNGELLDVIAIEIAKCDLLFALIGQNWEGRDANGSRRIDSIDDFIHIELAAAFRVGVKVIPLFFSRKGFDLVAPLPADITSISSLSAVTIQHEHFETIVHRLALRYGWRYQFAFGSVELPNPEKLRRLSLVQSLALLLTGVGIGLTVDQIQKRILDQRSDFRRFLQRIFVTKSMSTQLGKIKKITPDLYWREVLQLCFWEGLISLSVQSPEVALANVRKKAEDLLYEILSFTVIETFFRIDDVMYSPEKYAHLRDSLGEYLEVDVQAVVPTSEIKKVWDQIITRLKKRHMVDAIEDTVRVLRITVIVQAGIEEMLKSPIATARSGIYA
jgi:transposase